MITKGNYGIITAEVLVAVIIWEFMRVQVFRQCRNALAQLYHEFLQIHDIIKSKENINI